MKWLGVFLLMACSSGPTWMECPEGQTVARYTATDSTGALVFDEHWCMDQVRAESLLVLP